MSNIEWSEEQLQVINSEGQSRLVVDAGPGTGKTAVACKRIAELINRGFCLPHEIIVISFTNTAVYEIRERIKQYLSNESDVLNIKVSTLDSFAGKLRAGFDSLNLTDTSFDQNISKASILLFSEPNVEEFLKIIKHVVIDEAQDIVGDRSIFILELFAKLSSGCGVSVFSDDAQAIYGFTSEDSDTETSKDTLPESIRRYNSYFPIGFNFLLLKIVFRTENEKMKSLFSNGRALLRESREEPSIIYQRLRELILDSSDIDLPTAKEILEVNDDDPEEWQQDFTDVFLVFRKRGEALQASTHLGARPRRIRLSGLPSPIKPWLSDIFWNYEEDEIRESEFRRRFEANCTKKGYSISASEAWDLVSSECGVSKSTVSVRNLRTKLSRHAPNPEFTYSDYGVGGPIFASIHASKGRESKGVLLFLPKEHIRVDASPEEIYEEARVLFVGATRAKEEVLVFNGEDYAPISALKSSGRAYSYLSTKKYSVSVEIGRREDVSPFSLVGTELFDDYADVANGQRRLRNNPFEVLECTIFGSTSDKGYQYGAVLKQTDKSKQSQERTLFYLDQNVNRDLWKLANIMGSRTKPPTFFTPIYSLGVRSMVLPAGDIRLEKLHEPWRSSGFIHAPMVSGYPFMRFDKKGF